MWLSKTIAAESSSVSPITANVLHSEEGKITVSGLESCENIQIAAPFGIACVPPRGSTAVVLPVSGSAVSCGFIGQNSLSLEEGEVGLYSSGGASIILKNDGSVVINGRVFEKEES